MRRELENFDWHVYGISVEDFNYTIQLTEEIIQGRIRNFNEQLHKLENNMIADEAIDDLNYYNKIENSYLWHFALWRLQGLFEGFLRQEFLPELELVGLSAKIKHVQKSNYTINNTDFDMIIKWGKIRNALSHNPPEKNRPGFLSADDVKEYQQLILKIVGDLLDQKSKRTITPRKPNA